MQFGIPITTIKGGINALRRVILYPNKCIVARQNTTPIITTSSDKIILLRLLKKARSINADNNTDPNKNHFISVATLVAIFVRINGSPLKRICNLFLLPNALDRL